METNKIYITEYYLILSIVDKLQNLTISGLVKFIVDK